MHMKTPRVTDAQRGPSESFEEQGILSDFDFDNRYIRLK